MVEDGDPKWLPGDRTKILAWVMEKRLECPVCHTRHEEWVNDPLAYSVDTWRCPGCEKIEWEKQAWNDEPVSAKGIYFQLVKPGQDTRGTMGVMGPNQTK